MFDESSTNASVYELLTKDIIHAAVEGFNGNLNQIQIRINRFFQSFDFMELLWFLLGTAFAYGQTSSGKTFTMTGSETDPGIIRRSVRDVFERIHMVGIIFVKWFLK